MAINTGVNTSKFIAYAVLTPSVGVDTTKLIAYSVLATTNVNPPVWPSFTFPNGVISIAYSQTWDLTPAASPTTYSVVAGALPTGLNLTSPSGDLGTISGIPTVLGTFAFTLRATNTFGSADKAFSITIVDSSAGSNAAWVF